MSTEVGHAYVTIMPDAAGFGRELSRQTNSASASAGRSSGHSFGGAFAAVAGGLVAGAGILGILKDSYQGIAEDLKLTKLTAQVIKTTGGVAKVTTKQVTDLADAIEAKTGVDGAAIQASENMLLTFTSVRNEVGKGNDIFNQATSIVQDMSVALGQDGKAGAIQLGKALNDPIAGVSALSKVGVSFTAKQKETIKGLVEHNNVLGAQKIILGELNKEFGGAAAAQVTDADKLRVAWGKFEDVIGGILVPLVAKLASGLSTVAQWATEWFQGITDSSIGPTIKAISVWFSGTLLPVLKQVAGFVVDHLVAAWNFLSEVFTKYVLPAVKAVVPVLVGMWQSIAPVIGKLWAAFQQVAVFVREHLMVAFGHLRDIFVDHVVPAFQAVWKVLAGIFKGIANAIGPAVKWVLARLGELLDFFNAVAVPALKWVFDFIKRNADWLVPLTLGVGAFILVLKGLPVAMAAFRFLPGIFNRAALAAGASTAAVAGFQAALLNIGVVGVGALVWVVADAFKSAAQYSKDVATASDKIATAFSNGKAGVDATSTAVQGLINKVSINNGMFKELNKIAANTAIDQLKQDILDEAKALGITGESYGKIKLAADAYATAVKLYGAESGQAKLKLIDLTTVQAAAKKSSDTLSVATQNVTKNINAIPKGHETRLTGAYQDLLTKVAIGKKTIASLPPEKTTKLKADIAQSEAAIADIEKKLALYARQTYTANVKTIYSNGGTSVTTVNGAAVSAATGGLITGPGTGTSDSIHAMLSNGEYVVPASAVAKHYSLLEAMRSGTLPGYAGGGVVGPNVQMNLITRPLQEVILEQWKKGIKGITDSLGQAFGFGGGSTYAGGGSLGQWIARALAITGHPDWAPALYGLVMHESGGNPNAINNYDINAQRGDPSRGLAQTIMSTFQAYRDPSLPNNIYDPISNLVAACHYIEAVYGSIYQIASYRGGTSFVGGYANGSNYIPRTGLAMVHQGEAVVPRRYNPAAGGAAAGWAGSQDRTVEAFREAMRGMRVELDGQLVGRVQAAYSTRLARR